MKPMERCEMRMKAETLQQVEKISTEKECSRAQVIREFVKFGLEHTDSVYGKKEALKNPPEAPVIDLDAVPKPEPLEAKPDPENPQEQSTESKPESTEVETVESEPTEEKPPLPEGETETPETPPEPEKEVSENPGKLLAIVTKRMGKEAKKEIVESAIEG